MKSFGPTHARRLPYFGMLVAFAMLASTVTAPPAMADDDKGYLGIYMQELTRNVKRGLDLKVDRGVLINNVADDSPAEDAGLREGDVIVQFDGKDVEDPDELADLVSNTSPGDKIKVKIVRDGKEKTLTVTIGERDDDVWFFNNGDGFDFDFGKNGQFGRGLRNMVVEIAGPRLGVEVHEVGRELGEYFDTDKGMLVLDVSDESMAEEAGVEVGDVITKIGDEDIREWGDIGEALQEFDEGDDVKIEVVRKGKKQTLSAEMDDKLVRNWRGRAPNVDFNWDGPRNVWRHRAPMRVERLHGNDAELREELDELRRELKELKKELKKDRG